MTAREAELQIDGDTHELLKLVRGSIGGEAVRLGEKGRCRFCGTDNERKFRSVAHTVPEALGNKWIISLDECDDCNALFSQYEDALAKTVGPILTIGGTLGKANKVRQTGRSKGPAFIKHDQSEAGRRISIQMTGEFADHIGIDPVNGTVSFKVPVAPERFIPRRAYKALARMGLAMLPAEELPNFQHLITWVRDPDAQAPMPPLMVGLSFGSIGNAPRLVSAALLRRKADATDPPYLVFIVSAGSVCFQLDLKSDSRDGDWPPTQSVDTNIRWTNVIGAPGRSDIRIEYGMPVHLDWSSPELELSPMESVTTTVNPRTGHGRMKFKFREGAR